MVEASIDMNECAHISREDAQATARGAEFGHMRRRIDPRVSLFVLLIMNIAAFVASSLALEIAAVAFDALLMLYLKRPRLMLGWLAAFALILGIYFACVAAGPFFMPVSTCFLTFCRIFPSAMFAAAMISTTYVGEMAYALQTFGLTNRMTVAVCVALRFFPTAYREARAVREAMLTRGIRLTPLAIIKHPLSLLEDFMVPYIHRISIVADELGDAVMVRAIEASSKRTCYHELKISFADVAVMFFAMAFLVIAVAGRFM